MDKLKRYIDIHIPISTCNFKCHYCYVPRCGKYGSEKLHFNYSPTQICAALTKKRLGGKCLFTVCGMGETLIPHETIEIAEGLLKEGHYVTLVTNGSLTNRFDEIKNSFNSDIMKRLLFKFSLHWLELKRLNLLQTFADNVKKMRNAGASISVELTANDETEPYIPEIIEFTENEFGARCHISIPRDEETFEFKLQSKHNIDQFYNIWKVFDSDLLNFKYSIWGKKRNEYCYAGEWSGLLNIQNGEWRSCYHSHLSENIIENPDKPIPFIPVGKHCAITHCFNGHSWLTLGDIPLINSHTYADVRDRVCNDGDHWLNNEYQNFISQRLSDNNKYPHNAIENLEFNIKKITCYSKKAFNKIKNNK